MAARDPDQSPAARAARAPLPPLDAGELAVRLDEEIGRAERYGTKLSCLLVVVDNLGEIVSEHGAGLAEQTIAYIAEALGRELRRFDRVGRPGDGELLVLLPGTDSPLGEVVARRLLERIHTIKVESRGTRRPLDIAVGLAAWEPSMPARELLARAHAAARRQNGEDHPFAHLAGGATGGAAGSAPPAQPGREDDIRCTDPRVGPGGST